MSSPLFSSPPLQSKPQNTSMYDVREKYHKACRIRISSKERDEWRQQNIQHLERLNSLRELLQGDPNLSDISKFSPSELALRVPDLVSFMQSRWNNQSHQEDNIQKYFLIILSNVIPMWNLEREDLHLISMLVRRNIKARLKDPEFIAMMALFTKRLFSRHYQLYCTKSEKEEFLLQNKDRGVVPAEENPENTQRYNEEVFLPIIMHSLMSEQYSGNASQSSKELLIKALSGMFFYDEEVLEGRIGCMEAIQRNSKVINLVICFVHKAVIVKDHKETKPSPETEVILSESLEFLRRSVYNCDISHQFLDNTRCVQILSHFLRFGSSKQKALVSNITEGLFRFNETKYKLLNTYLPNTFLPTIMKADTPKWVTTAKALLQTTPEVMDAWREHMIVKIIDFFKSKTPLLDIMDSSLTILKLIWTNEYDKGGRQYYELFGRLEGWGMLEGAMSEEEGVGGSKEVSEKVTQLLCLREHMD